MTDLVKELELFEHDYNDPGYYPIPESALYNVTSGRCYYCGTVLRPEIVTIDHVLALANGGGNETGNLAPACRRCNCMKGVILVEEFRWLLFRQLACEAFTPRQLKWLQFHGFNTGMYGRFWGENKGLLLPLVQYTEKRRRPVNYELGRYGNLKPV